MNCGPDHELSMFVDKTLDAAERARVAQHLDDCSDCRTIVARLAQLHHAHNASGPPLGQMLTDRYMLDRRLGGGRFGSVYRAHDVTLELPVAIRVVDATDPAVPRALRGLVAMHRRLRHPNICRFVDLLPTPKGVALVMDLVDGQHLTNGMPKRLVIETLQGVCAALAEAHAAGLCHGSLRATSVLVELDETTRLVDIGLAGALGTQANMAADIEALRRLVADSAGVHVSQGGIAAIRQALVECSTTTNTSAPAREDPTILDRTVAGRYRIGQRLGKGGMGSVWLAEHLGLRTQVAVKFIAPELLESHPDAVIRFQQEAAAAAKIKSPHVVQMLDYGVMDNGTPFIVMERLDGQSVADRIASKGPMCGQETLEMVRQAGKALDHAHALNIIHRDIKPDNIFLQTVHEDTVVKILDFGIAKQPGLAAANCLTNTGSLLGTPAYMSPEHIIDAKHVGRQTDLWALAIVAYEAMTGHLPFDAPTVGGILSAIAKLNYTLPSRHGLPATMDDWCARAFHVEPQKRFGSAKELADALERQLREANILPAGKTKLPHPVASATPSVEANAIMPPHASDIIAAPGKHPHRTAAPVDADAGAHVAQTVLPIQTVVGTSATVFPTRRKARFGSPMLAAASAGLAALVMVGLSLFAGDDAGDALAEGSSTSSAKANAAGAPTGSMATKPTVSPPLPPQGMVLIEAGTYPLGCRAKSKDCHDDEKPLQMLSTARFAMMKHEVTAGEYDGCVVKGACPEPSQKEGCTWRRPGLEGHPINCVDWGAATKYCASRGWQLPTEAQWEIAALGVQEVDYPWGKQAASCTVAVLANNKGPGCGAHVALPIGARPRDVSWAGVHDLGGSMREWTASDYAPYPGGAIHGSDKGKVSRGSSWVIKSSQVNTGHTRGVDRATESQRDLGFRCVAKLDG